MSSLVGKGIELDAVCSSSNPTLPQNAFACWLRPCCVTWDAVPKPQWLLKLL